MAKLESFEGFQCQTLIEINRKLQVVSVVTMTSNTVALATNFAHLLFLLLRQSQNLC